MLYTIAAILVVIWLVSFLALHVSSFLIHLLLIAAVIAVVMNFFKGRSTRT
jgi:hypothetical protein